MNKLILITVAVSFMLTAQAQTKTTTKTTTKMTTTTTTTEKTEEPSATDTIKRHVDDSLKTANQVLTESADLRTTKDYGLFLNYSPIDLIIPSKIGGSFYIASADKMNQYEFQFLTSTLAISSSVDIASMTEQKFSVFNRNFYQGSNFNWYYGVSYATLEAKLGSEYMNSIPPSQRIDSEMMKIHVVALDIGVGNRWYFENGVNFGVDWIGASQPIATVKKDQHFTDYTTNQNDKDDLEKFLSLMTSLPRIYLLKLQLGYSF